MASEDISEAASEVPSEVASEVASETIPEKGISASEEASQSKSELELESESKSKGESKSESESGFVSESESGPNSSSEEGTMVGGQKSKSSQLSASESSQASESQSSSSSSSEQEPGSSLWVYTGICGELRTGSEDSDWCLVSDECTVGYRKVYPWESGAVLVALKAGDVDAAQAMDGAGHQTEICDPTDTTNFRGIVRTECIAGGGLGGQLGAGEVSSPRDHYLTDCEIENVQRQVRGFTGEGTGTEGPADAPPVIDGRDTRWVMLSDSKQHTDAGYWAIDMGLEYTDDNTLVDGDDYGDQPVRATHLNDTFNCPDAFDDTLISTVSDVKKQADGSYNICITHECVSVSSVSSSSSSLSSSVSESKSSSESSKSES